VWGGVVVFSISWWRMWMKMVMLVSPPHWMLVDVRGEGEGEGEGDVGVVGVACVLLYALVLVVVYLSSKCVV
jgi:hypothetical protein